MLKERENRLLEFLSVPFLVVLGAIFLLGAVWPAWRRGISDWVGEVNFVYFGMGFLFFYTALLVAEKNLMRRKFLGLMEEIMSFFMGQDYRNVGEAVEILLQGLHTEDEKAKNTAAGQLRRLTGADFGTDYAAWSAWWSENRAAFLLKRRKASLMNGRRSDEPSG